MGRTTATYSRFSLIRRIAREMFVNGYRGYSDYMDSSVKNRRYADQTTMIRNCLKDSVLWPDHGRNWITLDTVRIVRNPLYRLFKASKMSNTFQYALYFAILDMFEHDKELSLAEIVSQLANKYRINPMTFSRKDIVKKLINLHNHDKYNRFANYLFPKSELSTLISNSTDKKTIERTISSAIEPKIKHYIDKDLLYSIPDSGLAISEMLEQTAPKGGKFRMIYDFFCECLPKYNKSTLHYLLDDYVSFGILKMTGKGRYAISKFTPYSSDHKGLFDRYPGLINAIKFYSESDCLGILGALILNNLNTENDLYVFKHKCISNILDSIVMCDIFQAINSKAVIEIRNEEKRREEQFVALPIKVLSSVMDGRQYAFVYDLNNEMFRSVRIDSTFSVVIQNISDEEFRAHTTGKTKEEIISDGFVHLNNVWASSIYKYPLSKVTVIFEYDPVEEKHIYQRIMRECRNGSYRSEDGAGIIRYECDVYDPGEMVPWLLSLTGHIKSIDVEGNRDTCAMLKNRLNDHLKKLKDIYEGNVKATSSIRHPYQPVSDELLNKWREGKNSSELFSPFNSVYIEIYRSVLRSIDQPTEEEIMKKYINEATSIYGFEDSYKDISFSTMLERGMICKCDNEGGWTMMKNGKPLYDSYLLHKGAMLYRPFSNLELRWLSSIIMDKRMQLFLDAEEIEALKVELSDYAPLYTAQDISFFDMYRDGDAYHDPRYITNFRALLEALRSYPAAYRIAYKTERLDDVKNQIIVPVKLEYSLRDNKFRLLAHEVREEATDCGRELVENEDRLLAFRVSGIMSVESVRGERIVFKPCGWDDVEERLLCDEPVEVCVSNNYNALERFMTAVSMYRKESQYNVDTDTCTVRIWYAKPDERELLSTLRRFGGAIEVIGPNKVRAEIIKRVDRQYRLFEESGYNLE